MSPLLHEAQSGVFCDTFGSILYSSGKTPLGGGQNVTSKQQEGRALVLSWEAVG